MNFWRRFLGNSSSETQSRQNEAKAPEDTLRRQTLSRSKPTKVSALPSARTELNGKLIDAVQSRSTDDVRSLLAAGADPNSSKEQMHRGTWKGGKFPAMHFAIAESWNNNQEEDACIQIMELLLECGADINAFGADANNSDSGPFTVLMNAAQRNRPRTFEWLLGRGADPSLRRPDGRTAFRLCMEDNRNTNNQERWKIIRALAKCSQDGKEWANSTEGKKWMQDTTDDPTAPLGVSPMSAWNVFQSAMGTSTKRQAEIIKWVESGGDVNWKCANGMTLLHYAAMQNDEGLARFLLEHGANVNSVGNFNMTPLLEACRSISTSVVPILLEYGADTRVKSGNGYTSLQFIMQSGRDDAKRMADLISSRGVQTIPGKDSPCPECGAPALAEQMTKRGIHGTLAGGKLVLVASFSCTGCEAGQEIELSSIDKTKGVQVLCRSCGVVSFVPPSVWCTTCGQGLSTGWQTNISRVSI